MCILCPAARPLAADCPAADLSLARKADLTKSVSYDLPAQSRAVLSVWSIEQMSDQLINTY